MRIRPVALCFGLAVMSGFAVTAHAQTYTFTLLQNVAGGMQNSVVLAINSSGESVGWSQTSSGIDAVLWSTTGVPEVLADLGGEGASAALAINASGQSVGWSVTATGEDPVLWSSKGTATMLGKGGAYGTAAVAINVNGESAGYQKTTKGYDAILWHAKGVAKLLGDPGQEHFAQALAINGSGHSAGYACTTVTAGNCKDTEAVEWAPGGKATVLDYADGGSDSEALAINKSDYAVGWSTTATGGYDAVRWSSIGFATVLQGLNGSLVSLAVAENNHGQSIGYSDTQSGGDDAILWGPQGGIVAVLKDPGGVGIEFALAINDSGRSVGYACTSVSDGACVDTEAVLWQSTGKATNLGGLLGPDWTNTEALGINDLGDIIGYGDYNNGTLNGTYGFLLTPSAGAAISAIPGSAAAAPEPSTWVMLVAGFAGLGFAGYRGKREGKLGVKAWPKAVGPSQRNRRDQPFRPVELYT